MFDLQGFGDQLLEGATVTIELALASLVVGLILGTLAAVARLSDNRIAQKVATLYSTVIRGIPELLTVLIIYFGTATLLMAIARQFGYDEYIEIGPFTAGVIALGLTFGAYASEVLRGAIQAVPAGQIEAARAYRMPPLMLPLSA